LGGGPKGFDAGKKVKGRKRHILVDTNGLLLQVCVHAANIQEREGAKLLLQELLLQELLLQELLLQELLLQDKTRWRFASHRLKLIWADAGYWGHTFASWVQENCGVALEVISRNHLVNRQHEHKSYVPLPRRWVVERTFAWLGRFGTMPTTF